MDAATCVDISPRYGYLGEGLPCTRLPQYFDTWEALLERLPKEITNQTLRGAVEKLPMVTFDSDTLKSAREWQRAFLLLSFLAQGYIWMEGEHSVVDKLPRKLAIPWVTVCKRLEMKPAATYAATVLYNFGLRDESAPRDSLDNVYALHTFTGTSDESHFYQIHVLMEMASAPAVEAIRAMHELMAAQNNEKIKTSLKVITQSMKEVRAVVGKMDKGCKPVKFYRHIRPFFSAKHKKTKYEGTREFDDLNGASAAQSTSIYALSILLGVESSQKTRKFMLDMIHCMPANHSQFLVDLKQKPSFRAYCQESDDKDLIACFNEVVEELVGFRTDHIVLVTRYIVNPAGSVDVKGSGGAAEAVQFLKNIRDKTVEALIH